MTEDLALELRAVDAGYGATPVIHDVSLEVPLSSVVALLGPNGVGKTTTLRVAAGLLRPTGGAVMIAGTEVSRTAPLRRATSAPRLAWQPWWRCSAATPRSTARPWRRT